MNDQPLASVPGQTTTPEGLGQSAFESGPDQTDFLIGML